MIAAPHSGAGKTTVTLALLAALKQRGLSPVAFKCGPDYIDPLFHREVLGVPSYNLDLFFTGEETACGLLKEHAQGAGVAVIEGVMGYYDGVNHTLQAGSYDLARATGTPAVLVISARGASLSLAALVKGFTEFRNPSRIAGVILNDCSAVLYPQLKEIIAAETGLPVLGHLSRRSEYGLPSRHLGLVTAAEIPGLREKLARLGRQGEQDLEIDRLLELAGSAPPLNGRLPEIPGATSGRPRIAVARDAAFCFYYADNLALLERLGAEIVPFSPLAAAALPRDAGGLYLGGGYPELYAQRLSENTSLREEIRRAVNGGMPTLAECGGFLYLHDTLEDHQGQAYPMAGVLPGKGYKTPRRQPFGYVTLTARRDTLLCGAGESMPAHEFHYWGSDLVGDACRARKPDGRSWPCVVGSDTLFAGFPHLYFYSNPAFAARLVKAAAAYGGIIDGL